MPIFLLRISELPAMIIEKEKKARANSPEAPPRIVGLLNAEASSRDP
jgi:hypothetical protein